MKALNNVTKNMKVNFYVVGQAKDHSILAMSTMIFSDKNSEKSFSHFFVEPEMMLTQSCKTFSRVLFNTAEKVI